MKKRLIDEHKNVIDKKFATFLKYNNVYKEYWYNCQNDNSGIPYQDVANPSQYIDKAFNWDNTPEDNYLWNRIELLWNNILYKKYSEDTKKNKLLKL